MIVTPELITSRKNKLTKPAEVASIRLGQQDPLQAIKGWFKLKPELFKKQPYCLPGCDRLATVFLSQFEWPIFAELCRAHDRM
ncbi:hypothetical protein G8E03_03595 [Pontibrevibacter nitratireducens]|uniref:Uncharacterized protein n=1 Tax=Pontivivens nitratireducens TaxID=2758038 RepID=A0A6G7VHD5_9RHOB|nr:hypothetical protein G8E03_03595 [Pontibrevibacter nitratireducens]